MNSHQQKSRRSSSLHPLVGVVLWLALWAAPETARGGGVVANCTETDLNSALSSGGTVTFACDGTITVTSTKVISANTTLDGSGRSVTISGGNAVRLFTVNSNFSLTLLNLTIANGRSTNGGSVYGTNGATFSASNCTFIGNSAIGSNGIAGAKGADDPVTGGTGGGGGSGTRGLGGAIYNLGTATVSRCMFQLNTAAGGNGGNGGAGGNVPDPGGSQGGKGGSAGSGNTAFGGAIYSSNFIALANCTFSSNSVLGGSAGIGGTGGTGPQAGYNGNGAVGGEASGGGIYILRNATVNNCTFSENIGQGGNGSDGGTQDSGAGYNGSNGGASLGGGVFSSGTNALVNCTFATNKVTGGNAGNGGTGVTDIGGDGGIGGSGQGGGFWNSGRAWVTNCTFSAGGVYGGNSGLAGTGVFPGNNGSASVALGGNIANNGGTFTLKNSILTYKLSDSNAYGTITNAGNNISSDATPTLSGPTSTNNVDPKLLSLADNGGPTRTCALQTNSPAIDKGDTNGCPTLDQRGYFRTNACDIGAFEYNGYPLPSAFIVAGGPSASEDGDIGIFTIYRVNDLWLSVTVNFSVGGTASNGVDYAQITNWVTIPANAYGSRIPIRALADGLPEANETVQLTLLPSTNYFVDPAYINNAVVTISQASSIDRTSQAGGPSHARFWRGSGTDPNCQSFVIPLDFENGMAFNAAGGNAANWYPGNPWATNFYHLDATNAGPQTNISNRIVFQNPIAAFGSRIGGSPLFTNQDYSFGVYAGYHTTNLITAVRIQVYSLSNSAYVGTITNLFPNLNDTNELATFVNNGWTKMTEGYGLRTVLSMEPYPRWGMLAANSYILRHKAVSATATNYYFVVEDNGFDFLQEPLVLNSSGAQDWSKLYTLEFNVRPAGRALFIDQPQFSGAPLPPAYEGKSLQELTNVTATMPDVSFLVSSNYLAVNGSPELRRHSILDGFVNDMGNDPLALANYVINEIDLTDAIDYDTNQNLQAAVNLGGVNRSALATFQEGQGSPLEQCALLVYLLRQAGVPAAYVYPTNNGLQMLDFQVSQLLGFQIKGALNDWGQTNLPQLIALNYPWVTAYITNEARWVHILPWLKDREVVEGWDLYDFMPTNYNSGHKWLTQFCLGDTNIFSLSDSDQPLDLWPKFIQEQLDTYGLGLSVDDMGVQLVSRRHLYNKWDDFPKPFALTGTPLVWESLKTNLNLFNTLQIRAYSAADTNKFIDTTEMRVSDLHNRKLLLKFLQVGTNNAHDMVLSLASYSPAITNQALFGTNADPTYKLVSTNRFTNTDDVIKFRVTHRRLRMLPAGYVAPGIQTNLWQINYSEQGPVTWGQLYQTEDTFRKGDLVTFCLDAGRVSRKMLNVQAQEIWQFNQNANTNNPASLDKDVYQGTTAYLLGMSCFNYIDRFNDLDDRLHKMRVVSRYQYGYGLLRPQRDANSLLISNGVVTLIEPAVHLPQNGLATVFNASLHPDSGRDIYSAHLDWWLHQGVAGSAAEHGALRSFYQTNAISTVKLLQQVGANMLHLNKSNYLAYGNATYGGVALKNADTNIWNSILAFFSQGLFDEEVLMTPGTVTNGTYQGVGAFLISQTVLGSLVGGLNGAVSWDFAPPTFQDPNSVNLKLTPNPDNSVTDFRLQTAPAAGNSGYMVDAAPITSDLANTQTQIGSGQVQVDPAMSQAASGFNAQNGTPGGTTANGFGLGYNSGEVGQTSANNDKSNFLLDPVNSVTGEFYVDAVDLTLPGPMPLQVRRNYGSQNLAENEFGFGWKINYVPFLSLSTNSTLIYAAEMDGTVVAYRQQGNTNLWLPTAADNPTLNNNSSAGIGSLANLFNNRIQLSGTNYTLTGADGSVRTFTQRQYPVGGFNRTRPYLDTWQDNRGNYYSFQYGTDSSQPDYGELRRIQSSSGSFLGFYFDPFGHIIEAYTGDGRRLKFEYDKFADLVTVTLPDASQFNYEYQHLNYVTNSVTNLYSTHLIVQELKPDGRILKNDYDALRRVINQYATVGADLSLIRNGTFVYSNNFALNSTNPITGKTDIYDYTNRVTTYYYTNSLIRKIVDPLNQTVVQDWYESDSTSGAYRRSLKSTTDKRGLQTSYAYDPNGNITNLVAQGDLTGDGNGSQQATGFFIFSTNNLLQQSVDASGVTNKYFYTNTWLVSRVETWPLNASGANIVTNSFLYYGVTNPLNAAQFSLGLRQREVRADGSSDAATSQWSHDYRGFPTNQVQYTGTGDPDLTRQFVFNARGELVERTDAAGRKAKFGFDAMSRKLWEEVYEAGQTTPLASTYFYYNANGELAWTDGPRSNPEDFIFRDYDGAGRKTQETRWRSRAKQDGSGVEADTGDNLYATTFFHYDPFSNLVLTVNPRAVATSNTFDAIGQMLSTTVIDANGAVLKSESFLYEPGGLVTNYTNPLGGVTQKKYTSTGKPRFQQNPDGTTNGWRYQLDGRLATNFLSNGAYWRTIYDDANRTVTNIFYSAANAPLATNSSTLDRRGNLIKSMDLERFVSTNLFDGLDRMKISAGPAITNRCRDWDFSYYWTTNQQVITRSFDASGATLAITNSLGEGTLSSFDALGRPTGSAIYNADGTLVRTNSIAYAANHHSYTTTAGRGTNAIVTTTFTDNDGHTVLTQHFPVFGQASPMEFTLQTYDLAGNLTALRECSSSNGMVTIWATNQWTFDGLNRVATETVKDGATTSYGYNSSGNMTNRAMPDGLGWSASFNSAGQMLSEQLTGGGLTSRSFTYRIIRPEVLASASCKPGLMAAASPRPRLTMISCAPPLSAPAGRTTNTT